MSAFWEKNFVNDYKSLNNDKIVTTLLWDENKEEIFEQLSNSIKNESDIILSEILPDELPSDITVREYEYFLKKFIFCPPQIHSQEIEASLNEKKISLVILDECYNGVFTKSHIKDVFINEIVKSKDYDYFIFKNELNYTNELNDIFNDVTNVILISVSPSLISFVVQSSLLFKFNLNVYPKVKSSNRFHGLGLTIENNACRSKHESIRSNLNTLFSNNIIISTSSEKTLEALFKVNSIESFNEFNKDPYVIFYFSEVYKSKIDKYLWARSLPNNEMANRFKRRLIHSLLNTEYSHDYQLFNFAIKCLLNEFLLSLSENYSACFDEVENEITSLIINYYVKYESIFDEVFENIKPQNDNSENAIHSIIGECFILSYFYCNINKKNNDLFLNKAHLFLSKDIVKGETRYIHYKSYIEVIDLIRKKETELLTTNSHNTKIPFKLTPFLFNLNDLESIINTKENPYNDEITWFFKNILRANGRCFFYLKNVLSQLRKNQSLCDFFKKHCNSKPSSLLNIITYDTILDRYNTTNIDFNSKVISLIYYKKFNNSSIDSFILRCIDVNNIKNEECIMLFSILSKEYILSQMNLTFIKELINKDIFRMLKPSYNAFNFCLYRLSMLINHPDSIKLLRFSESQNPLHFYLHSQFE